MTPQTKYDEHVLIQEQREETERILKAASEKGRKPIRKLDTLDARFIVREKRRGTSNKTIAGILKVCIRQVQRIWSRFRRLDTGRILYLPRRPRQAPEGRAGAQGALRGPCRVRPGRKRRVCHILAHQERGGPCPKGRRAPGAA